MTRTLPRKPARDGYRMPAEFEPHSGCWMLWPERPDNWRESGKPAQHAFATVAAAISRFEPVTVGASPAHFERARQQLAHQIRVVEMTHDDAWMRDVGPTFVVDGKGGVRGVDWRFNAWGGHRGGLYTSWDQDELVATKVLEIEGRDRYAADIVNEGGAIHVDGRGTALVTEECLLNPNRNPGMSRKEIEAVLRDYLGVKTIVWLGKGVHNDETSGHVDNLACFVKPGEVCLTWTDDTADPQHVISKDALERLQASKLTVHKLPSPGPLFMTDEEARGLVARPGTKPRPGGERLAGSYVNFYIANGGIVMPLLDARTDRAAAARLRKLFPGRRIVGVSAREILLGGGNIHCITQQVPLGRRASAVAPERASRGGRAGAGPRSPRGASASGRTRGKTAKR
jgi:agmatine deiminase